MLETEPRFNASFGGTDPSRVARALRECVIPCGVVPFRRLEATVGGKLAAARALERLPADRFSEEFVGVVSGVVSARRHAVAIVDGTPQEEVRAILREAREGRLGPADVPSTAERLVGGPREIRRDLASELLHAAAPDRTALLARWVWNPERGTGVLAEFGGPPPESYPETQARLGELRLALATFGFPSTSFATVDAVLALTYARRLGQTTENELSGRGVGDLLPGRFLLATMILGVRRCAADADC